MDKGSFESPDLNYFYKTVRKPLKLKPALGKVGFSRKINKFSVEKLTHFVHVFGKKDIERLGNSSSSSGRKQILNKIKKNSLCIILSKGTSLSPKIEYEARKKNIAIFYSELTKKDCLDYLRKNFEHIFLREVTISGGLLQVYGVGILITGDSGIGKSECALELVSRGHFFVSDDVVLVAKEDNHRLVGGAPSVLQNYMEIRGLGVINIKEIFGSDFIYPKVEINLVINLRKWKQGEEFDRLGLKFTEDCEIYGQRIPKLIIPVAPGRNMATLIEVACKVHLLKEKGYHAPQELIKKLNKTFS